MGLFDFLMNAKGSSEAAAPTSGGLMSKLNYGGVPFGVRLMAASEALRAVNNPNIERPGTLMLGRYSEMNAKTKKEEEELAKKQEKANRLADKLQLSNPALAEALRADPSLIDEYGKGIITDSFETNRYKRTRADAVEDRNFNAGLQREGWDRADQRTAIENQNQVSLQEDRQAFETDKQKAIWARDDALRAGRKAEAAMIEQGFLADTGQELPPPASTVPAPVPGPQAIPLPEPGSTTDAVTPPVPTRQVPGLLQPEAPAMPEEQGDAAPAPPAEVAAWTRYFKDPQLTPTEAAQLTFAFKSTLAQSMQDNKDPDSNLALGQAAEVYRKILENRVERQKADAATSEAETKAGDANRKQRMEAASTSEATIAKAQNRAQTGDDVLNAINDAKVAMDPKNADLLPATGAGSWMASFVGDSEYTGNARAIFNAVNTVKANLGFDALQKMREESPTGGALGQVAVQELEMLQAKVASLDATDSNFASNMEQVEKSYAKLKEVQTNYAEDIKNLRRFPTEEHKREFDEMYGVDAHLKFIGE